jgi:acetoin:2,6-dichlorophenolindophenol oxidoreductase subunit alpha
MVKSSSKQVYYQLYLIRRVEETLLDLFSKGLLRGTVHTCIGQEGCAVGVINAIDRKKDIVCSNHRGHGHFIAYCDDVEGLIYEVMGRPEGVCGGYGGSQHLHKNRFYSNGILGGMPPVAVGMALAEKLKSSGAISIVFMGDGSMGEGNVYEAFNMASLWNIPILFVVEHNQYAQSTHYSLEHAGVLSDRPKPFGIKSTVINGNDVIKVEQMSGQIINEIRADSRPQLLFLETYRIAPHSKGDDLRDPLEIERGKSNDPLKYLISNSSDKDWKEEVEKDVNDRILKLLNKLEVSL